MMNKININNHFICSISEPNSDLLLKNRDRINKILVDFGAVNLVDRHPVLLRWANSSTLGFPRQPFKVLRRVGSSAGLLELFPHQNFNYNFTTTTSANIYWDHLVQPLIYEIHFNLRIIGFGLVQIQALDKNFQPIPGQMITANTSKSGRIAIPCCMKAPNIIGLAISGKAILPPGGTNATASKSLQIKIGNLQGIDCELYINKSTWEETQIVGLPYTDGETGPPVYNPQPQGYFPNLVGDGVKAAKLRLELMKLLMPKIPSHPIGIPEMAWGPQDLQTYLEFVKEQNLSLVTECLESTDDFDPDNLQVNFVKEMVLDGIRQESSTITPSEDANSRIHVVGNTLVGIYADSYFATVMGYGTLAFLPINIEKEECLMPPGMIIGADFLVVNTFGILNEKTGKGALTKLVALAQNMPHPVTPTNLQANQLYQNRPEVLDGEGAESVKLSWNWPPYELTFSYFISWIKGGITPRFQLLNNKRMQGVGGFEPYFAARPFRAETEDSSLPPLDISKVFYTNSNMPIPLNGQRFDKYQVIGNDWFGRFSNWSNVNYTASSFPPQQALINDVRLFLNEGESAPEFLATLEVDFGWNWIDRSPDRIEFSGLFLSKTITTAPIVAPQTFAFKNGTLPVAQPLTIRFSGQIPFIVPEFIGEKPPSTVTPACYVINSPVPQRADDAPTPGTTSSDIRRYTLVIKVMTCDFSTVSELTYAIYARAYEAVQPTIAAKLIEKFESGTEREKAFLVRILDPTPPPPPEGLNTEINWTALPDATGIARGVIRWNNIPKAKGYNVWVATEAAIQEYIQDIEIPMLPENSSLQRRANYLRALLEGKTLNADFEIINPPTPKPDNTLQSLQAFSKLNKKLIKPTKLEVELPASADSLYAYRISAINELNVESEKSDTAFYAVPRLNQPGQPNLMLRPYQSPSSGVWVLAIPGAGVNPVGYRIYRVRKFGLATELGMMGLPKVKEDNADWLSFAEVLADSSLQKLHYLIQRLVKEEIKISGNSDPAANKVLQYGKAFFDAQGESWLPYFYQIVAIGQENTDLGERAGASLSSGAQQTAIMPTGAPILTDLSILGGGIFQQIDRIRIRGAKLMVYSSGSGHLYIENSSSDRVEVWSMLNNKLTHRIRLQNLNVIAVNEKRGEIYFVFNRTFLVIYNERTRRLGSPINLISSGNRFLQPRIFFPNLFTKEMVKDLVVDHKSNNIYVSFFRAAKILVLNKRNIKKIVIPTSTKNSLLAVSQKKNLLYAIGLNNQRIQIFNKKNNKSIRVISLPYQPRSVWVNNKTAKIYIEDASGNQFHVYPLDTTLIEETSIALDSSLKDVSIEESTGIVWLLKATGELQSIDGRTNEIIETQNVDTSSANMEVIPDLNRICISKPVLEEISILGKAETNVVLLFRTNLPVKKSPLGEAYIQLAMLRLETSTGKFIREPNFLTINPSEVAVAPVLQPIANASSAQLARMPEITRSEPDASDMVAYSVRITTALLTEGTIVVKSTNPNHKIIEEQFQRILE